MNKFLMKASMENLMIFFNKKIREEFSFNENLLFISDGEKSNSIPIEVELISVLPLQYD